MKIFLTLVWPNNLFVKQEKHHDESLVTLLKIVGPMYLLVIGTFYFWYFSIIMYIY